MGGVSLRVICGFQLNASFLTADFHYCVLICELLETSCWVSSCSLSEDRCAQSSVTKHSSGWQATPFNCQLKVLYMCLFCFFLSKKRTFVLTVSTHTTQCRSLLAELSVWRGPLFMVFHFIGQQVTTGLKKGSEGEKWERSTRHKLSLCFNLVGRNRWFCFTLFLMKSFPGHQ